MVRLVLVVATEEAKANEAVAQELLVSLLASEEAVELVVPVLEVLVEAVAGADGGLVVVVQQVQQQEQTMVVERLQQGQHKNYQNLSNLVVDQQTANLEAEDLH